MSKFLVIWIKSKLFWFILYFCLLRRKHGFSTPTHNLVSDCRFTEELCLSCQFLAAAGIAECSCYSPVDVAPLRGVSGAAVAAVMGTEKWRQTKVSACSPLSLSFWMTFFKMVQVVPYLQGPRIRELREWENKAEFELLIMVSNLSWYYEFYTQRGGNDWKGVTALQLCLSQ